MHRVAHFLTTLLVIVTFTVAVSVVQPQPVMALSDSEETLIIVLAGVIGGAMILALIITLIVRNNPAWMPLAPTPELSTHDRFGRPPDPGVRFGLGCGVRDGGVPLVCW